MTGHITRQALGLSETVNDTVITGSRLADGRDAKVFVLLLPTLILLWGVCAVVIAALA